MTTAKLASEHGDYPNDPRQSTLYYWWSRQATKIGNLGNKLITIENNLKLWEEKLKEIMSSRGDSLNIANGCSEISATRADINQLKNAVENAQKTVSSVRIAGSLKRFDSWFHYFLRSQNLRWFAFELALPVAFGATALVLLIKYSSWKLFQIGF
ncbi:MAG: hypothetical protein HY755_02730 [Nitrospirae bacterium]|nr:hypothetical protein [Nitrospirota bacterium]